MAEGTDEAFILGVIKGLENPNISTNLRKRLEGSIEGICEGNAAPLVAYLKSTPASDDEFKQYARTQVVKTLGRLGENGKLGKDEREAIIALVLELNDPEVKSAARRALMKIGAVAPKVTLEVLHSALETENKTLIAVRQDVTEIRNELLPQQKRLASTR